MPLRPRFEMNETASRLFDELLQDWDDLDRHWRSLDGLLGRRPLVHNNVEKPAEAPVAEPAADLQEEKFAIDVDVRDFKPEELKVEVAGGVLLVSGRHGEREEEGGGRVSRLVVRKFALPEDVDLDAIRSKLSDEGRLSVEAPRRVAAKVRSITIQKAD